MTNYIIDFPGLGLTLNPPAGFSIGSFEIRFYGLVIALGLILAVVYAMKRRQEFGISEDDLLDGVLWIAPFAIVCARLYYCAFEWDRYASNPISILYIWEGGIAIYGAVIAAVLVVVLYSRHKKVSTAAMMDAGVLGLILGQVIGRWANFVNREAFGGETDLPWRMRVWISEFQYADVHPTFFYESMWNLIGLLLLLFVVSKGRRFDGENTCFYFLWYGVGRFWIEGLREDSLYLFDWTFFGNPIRVSQALSAVLVVGALIVMIYNIKVKKPTAEDLWVNQMVKKSVEGETPVKESPGEGECS